MAPASARLGVLRRMCGLALAACAAAWNGSASAVLLDRGPDMVYDTVLNITWARDAGLAGNSLTWQQANAWAASLVLGGFDDWRLPSISVSGLDFPLGATTLFQIACGVGGPGSAAEIACRDNELAYMYWYNLEGPFGAAPQPGMDLTGDRTARGGELIENIQDRYWSSTAYSGDPNSAWLLNFTGFSSGPTPPGGYFDLQPKAFLLSAWAVRTGDVVITIPEPASAALLALALISFGFRLREYG